LRTLSKNENNVTISLNLFDRKVEKRNKPGDIFGPR